jgi:type I restriction enzyme, S subunit
MNNESVTIGEVAEVNPRLAADAKPKADVLVSFVPMAAVSEETLSIEEPVDRPYAEVAKGFTPFRRGDIIIAKITPCFENGKMAYAADLPRDLGFGSTEFHVLRPKGDLDGGYLFHLLREPFVRRAGEKKMKGAAGQRRVPADFFAKLQIPLPPLTEQKRIAGILDAADALRAKRREALAQLDALLQSTFLHLFGDPVTNPMGWDSSPKLGEIADIVSGITKGRKVRENNLRDVAYLAVVNVQDRYLKLDIVKAIAATESEIEKYALRAGDLLLTEGGDPDKLGRGTLWNNELYECIYQNHIFRVRLKTCDIDPVYLNWLVGSTRGKKYFLRSAKQTTGIASINMTQLKAFPMLVPPLTLQRHFAAIVESVERQKTRMRAHLAELDALFASLQSRAFNGEL